MRVACRLELTWATPCENNFQAIKSSPGYHHICLTFQDTNLTLFVDGKMVSTRVVPAYTIGEGKSNTGVEFVAGWEVPWEDNGMNDLCVYRFGLAAAQVEYLSNVALCSVVAVPPANNNTGAVFLRSTKSCVSILVCVKREYIHVVRARFILIIFFIPNNNHTSGDAES